LPAGLAGVAFDGTLPPAGGVFSIFLDEDLLSEGCVPEELLEEL